MMSFYQGIKHFQAKSLIFTKKNAQQLKKLTGHVKLFSALNYTATFLGAFFWRTNTPRDTFLTEGSRLSLLFTMV